MATIDPEQATRKIKRVLCILCGQLADLKYSTKKKPFIYCAHCMTRIFFNSERGEAGYFLTSELLLPVVEQHAKILEDRIDELVESKNEAYEKRRGKQKK